MNARRSLAAAGALGLGLSLGLFFSQPSAGQPPAAPPAAANGRYQMGVKPMGTITTVFVVDTQTGQCWYRDTAPETTGWTDMGSPARKVER